MKGKYIDLKTRLACLSTKQPVRKDIHTELMQTINEHKKIMQQLAEFINQYKKVA